MKNLSLLIHGAQDGHCLENVRQKLNSTAIEFGTIVIVSYVKDLNQYSDTIKNIFDGLNYRIVPVKDMINPGFANINRHVSQVNAGLVDLPRDSFVIKLRNDQNVDFDKLFGCIEKYELFREASDRKILTTNCYTRRDRYYHPSDMFMAAPHEVMCEYFDYPLMAETEIMKKMQVAEMFADDPTMTFNPIAPESELFRNFLKKNCWNMLETEDDSYSALKKFVYVLNSWDIELRWNKARNYPFTKINEIILPHFFTMAPFPGAPVEKHSCYMRDEIIGGTCNKLDKKYIYMAMSASISINMQGESKSIRSIRYKKRLLGFFRAILSPFGKTYLYFDKKYKKTIERIQNIERNEK